MIQTLFVVEKVHTNVHKIFQIFRQSVFVTFSIFLPLTFFLCNQYTFLRFFFYFSFSYYPLFTLWMWIRKKRSFHAFWKKAKTYFLLMSIILRFIATATTKMYKLKPLLYWGCFIFTVVSCTVFPPIKCVTTRPHISNIKYLSDLLRIMCPVTWTSLSPFHKEFANKVIKNKAKVSRHRKNPKL
jgi:hypothetical protein